MFEIVTFVENEEVESWLKKILGSVSKQKVYPIKIVVNNGIDDYGEEYNHLTKEYGLGIDIAKKIYEKVDKPIIIEFTDQLGKYNLLYKSSKAMLSLREHPKETKVHFANRLAENIKQVHFFK